MSELISIVLPVYNGERFLAESIESVINQTYQNWELLILDDCSKDNTACIAKKYSAKDNRIHYYLNEKNLRLPGNLNRGFSLAKGKYLTWTSDDNMYRPNALECMLNKLKENADIDLVYASYQVIDENRKPVMVSEADHRGKDHILGSNVVGACFLYTRKAYELVGDYDTDLLLVEDFDYWQRMFACVRATCIDEVLYDYRWHENSLTSTKKVQQFGYVCEKMLRKNMPLFGRLNIEQKAFYYKGIHQSCIDQNKKFEDIGKEKIFCILSRIRNKLSK